MAGLASHSHSLAVAYVMKSCCSPVLRLPEQTTTCSAEWEMYMSMAMGNLAILNTAVSFAPKELSAALTPTRRQ